MIRAAQVIADAHAPHVPPSTRLGFTAVIVAFLAIVSQTSVPSPLYPRYESDFHLTPLEITIVFAAYIVGIIATLLTVGSLSDSIGRRLPILAGAMLMIAADVVFLTAHSLDALIAARVLQGIGIGTANAALAAALADLVPRGRTQFASILAGALPPASLCLGILWGGTAAQLTHAQDEWAYGVSLAAGVLAVPVVLLIPDRGQRRPGAWTSLRPQIAVPELARPAFRAVVGALIAGWALIGLYLALVPSALTSAWPQANAFTRALPIAGALAAAALAGLALARVDEATAMRIALTSLITGSALTGGMFLLHDMRWQLFALGTAAAGFGFGGTFQSALRHIVAATPSRSRAAAMAAALAISFAAFGLPSVLAGALTPVLGIYTVAGAYAATVAAVGLVTACRYRKYRAAPESESTPIDSS